MNKPLKCTQCSFACTYNSKLQRHIRTHTREKPYKCDQCTYASADGGTLKKHILTHTGEKPYKCHICSYASIRKDKLEAHIRTHEKKHNCNRCSFVSVGKEALKAHMQTHIAKKPNKRNQCASTKMAQRLIPAENAQAITSDYLLPSTSSATGHNEIKYELEDFSMGPSSMNLVLNQIALNSIIAEKASDEASASNHLLPTTSSATGHNEIKEEPDDFYLGTSSVGSSLDNIENVNHPLVRYTKEFGNEKCGDEN
ncbi:c2H2-type zinc-finger domain-containing protein [Ditylenchus destructor]|nr:c2H2-type zinc-finger domain-containing protein [Ditylenchus destructor]